MENYPNSNFVPYKVKDLKIYGSPEWMANEQKKYRRVYDLAETTYIYAELSFYNKLFDEQDYSVRISLKCFGMKDGQRRELCNLTSEKPVSKDQSVVYVREGWGNKKPAAYWRPGAYEWEAYINDVLVATRPFYIEKIGLVTEDSNPYFAVSAIKMYEGPADNIPADERVYYKKFDANATRYIFVELTIDNLVIDHPWNCEIFLKFYNDAHQLKWEATEMFIVNPSDNKFTITSGWGSNDFGNWYLDKYTLQVIFMDHLVAVLPFEVSNVFEEGMNEAFLPGLGTTIIPETEEKAQTLDEVMAELSSLVGLQAIKTKIRDYAEYLKFIKIRMDKGIDDNHNLNLHTVFTGNPGTGKTTVAKMLGQIYRQMGLLSKGHVHEVDRAELVGEYIGQTAPKVKEAINKARGGILFIDEAYSLARAKDDSKDFGREVLEILIKEMSDGKGDLAVIVAGYPSEMRTFMESNPGLKSRFSIWFEFPDYLPQELLEIADYASNRMNISLTPQAKAYLYQKLVEGYRTRNRFFGNARYVNNILNEGKINLGLRVMKTENPRSLTREDLSSIKVDDLEPIFKTQQRQLPNIPINEELLEEAMKELNALTGLGNVKRELRDLVNLVRFYRETGKEVLNRFSLHGVFVGNPGTGKTTVARILSKIYKALGVLERGHLVECDRQALVAGYVGQTAIKTSEKIDEAIGGVLFIDEAYALTQQGNQDYGREAIETLLKRMEDQKGEFAVVVAGYTDNMKVFIESNPGLKSRFDRIITFEDFSLTELMQILLEGIAKEGYVLEEHAENFLRGYLDYLHSIRDKYFGNGRTVVKAISAIIKNQNLRLASLPAEERTPELLRLITLDDVKQLPDNKDIISSSSNIGFKR